MSDYSSNDFKNQLKNLNLPNGSPMYLILVIILGFAVLLIASSVGIVGAGQRGVLLRFGAVTSDIKDEGLYFKIPFAEQVVLMTTQIQKYSTLASASSKDLQVVTTEVTVNFHLDPSKVGEIYRSMRHDYEEKVIQPFVQEAVKSTAANFDAEQLITQRPKVKTDLQNLLTKRLAILGIDVIEVSITDFRFTQVFQDSIEAKVKAVQQALEAAAKVPFYEFPDDQGWIWHKLPRAAGWLAGPTSGIYGFKKPGWPPGDNLPADARLVAFPGARDPSQFTHLPWVRKYWR